MRDPREFPKSLTMLQVVDTSMYVVTAIVAYRYAGPDIASPALSSAGPVMKKVAYGIAMPTVRFILDSLTSSTFSLFHRLSLPVLSTATLPANTSMFAFSVALTTCTRRACLLLEPGLALPSPCG